MPLPINSNHFEKIRRRKEEEERKKYASEDEVIVCQVDSTSNQPSQIRFQLGRMIGTGTFGKVFEGVNADTGELIAVKRIELKTPQAKLLVEQIEKEIEMLKALRHKNVVALLGSSVDSSYFSILMELVSGRSLDDLLKDTGPLHENIIRGYTRQLLEALDFCHSKKVLHRDIKGKNVLLSANGVLKLADFGSAKFVDNLNLKEAPSQTYSYTPLWVAPEVINGAYDYKVDIWSVGCVVIEMSTQPTLWVAPEVINGAYDYKVDIWSVGCVVIEMSTASEPWAEKSFQSAFQALYHIGSSGEIPALPVDLLSREGIDFLKLCLQRDPALRPSASQLLKHPFVSNSLFDQQSDDTSSSSSSFASPTSDRMFDDRS